MKFLGRIQDPQTMIWFYPDGSGGELTEGMRQEVMYAEARRVKLPDGTWSGNGLFVLAAIAEIKERAGIKD